MVKDRFERAYHRRLTQIKQIVKGCVESNSANMRELKVIVRTKVHNELWLTQSSLINRYEYSMQIHCVNIEMKKLVHE